MKHIFDVLILGSGAAGLTLALRLPESFSIAVICKDDIAENSTQYAQGGIAAVLDSSDNFASHVKDTLVAGSGLNDKKAVQFTVENGPEAIDWLIGLGIEFSKKDDGQGFHLTKEGGHANRRIIHASDCTGKELEKTLVRTVKARKNIKVFRDHVAVDLIKRGENCVGAYILNEKLDRVDTFLAKSTAIATGGASRVYLYSTNPSVVSGDGIAMGYRAGCKVENLEFNQFHPTCMYNPKAGSFLITEAMRGEGAKLLLPNGSEFMGKFDARAELAPRDVVARAIDFEMKRLGIRHVFLDISFKPAEFIRGHFPNIFAHCLNCGIDITKEPIPVVPAAHYTCGGIKTDLHACTDVKNLYAIGEASCTGLHGANRLASNSLLECLVFATAAACHIKDNHAELTGGCEIPDWDDSRVEKAAEEVLLLHNWEEIRRTMWNYVGIVRSNERLVRARRRIQLLKEETQEYYARHRLNRNFIELRHLVQVAELIVKAAIERRASIGLHYNIDYPPL